MKENFEKPAFFDGKRFYNNKDTDVNDKNYKKKSLISFLKWRFSRSKNIEAWPKWIKNKSYKKPEHIISGNILRTTFINHSTVLLQLNNLNIITDPIWSERASPFSFLGPKRVREPGVKIDDLPKIDLILLSHDHYDHLDVKTLKTLDEKFSPVIISGTNINSVLKKHNLSAVELNWWENTYFKDLEIVFLPAKHWSGRKGFYGNNSTLWGSFLINFKNSKIYFAGDTAYSPHIKEINEKYGKIDLSLIPIGAYKPRWFMKESHTNPYEAVLIHKELESKNSLAVHHGTFRLSDESYEDPVNDLIIALNQLKSTKPFKALDSGESWDIILE